MQSITCICVCRPVCIILSVKGTYSCMYVCVDLCLCADVCVRICTVFSQVSAHGHLQITAQNKTGVGAYTEKQFYITYVNLLTCVCTCRHMLVYNHTFAQICMYFCLNAWACTYVCV